MWNTFSFSISRGKPLKAAQEQPLPVALNGPRQAGNSHLFEFTQEINQGKPLRLRHVSIMDCQTVLGRDFRL